MSYEYPVVYEEKHFEKGKYDYRIAVAFAQHRSGKKYVLFSKDGDFVYERYMSIPVGMLPEIIEMLKEISDEHSLADYRNRTERIRKVR